MTRLSMFVCCIVLLGLTWGCAKQTVPDTREADERAVRECEIEASKALAAKDLEGFLSFFADDAAGFYSKSPIITGKDALRQSWKTVLAIPGFAMSFQVVKVEVSRSGDLAWGHGTWTRTMNDDTGKPVTDKGKYVIVYRKQPDGKWKVVADIGNSDPPETATPAK
jgi:uncharacterized protein (TIGR02246 family)